MATFTQVGKKWRAQVRLARRRPQSKTFTTHAQAAAWARKIEGLEDGGVDHVDNDDLTIAHLIQAYRDLREGGEHPIADKTNEHYMLNKLDQHLGHLKAAMISTRHLVAFCKARRVEGANGYTINMDISKLGTVYRHAPAMLDDIKLPDVVGRARGHLRNAKLITRGGKREVRPTDDELERIYAHVAPHLAEIIRFAISSCMRRGEICRITWADIDRKKRCVWIRDRKDPRNKAGNDELVPLLGEAWDIVQRQPKIDERIFPYHEQTITKAFTQACKDLDIPDLHLHDMRHEGISRLFEQGYEIQQVALVSGHKKWEQLRRYTQLKPESLHHLHQRGGRDAALV